MDQSYLCTTTKLSTDDGDLNFDLFEINLAVDLVT